VGKKAFDLRRAFLLAVPRAEIIEKVIKPLNPEIPVLNSFMTVPGEPGYENILEIMDRPITLDLKLS